MRENVTISYRGAGYEIGRGEHFYGIWAASSSQPQPLEWWPATPEGWAAAWARFTSIETPGTIVPVGQSAAPVQAPAGPAAGPGQAGPSSGDVISSGPAGGGPLSGRHLGTLIAIALLAVGVVLGIAGLFPSYLGGASLAGQPDELAPHLIYLAAWAASAVLIFLGGTRRGVGTLLAVGVSAVTFGFFFADAGTAMAGGASVMGAGLVLGLVSWACAAAGSAVAFLARPAGGFGRPHSDDMGPVVMLMLAAIGTAAAFAPSWDSFTLRSAAGATQTLTEGNAFANPAQVIVGNVLVMVALVAVVAAAALWRPTRLGAALLAGAIIPMAAEAISALVQIGEAVSPAQFGISAGQASQIGLTISSGFTAAFWIYCAFLVALIASFAWMLIPPHGAVRQPPYVPHGPSAGPSDALPPETVVTGGTVDSAETVDGDETVDSAETVEATSVRPPTP